MASRRGAEAPYATSHVRRVQATTLSLSRRVTILFSQSRPPALHKIPELCRGAARPGRDAPGKSNNGIGFTRRPSRRNRLPMVLLRCRLLLPQRSVAVKPDPRLEPREEA